MRLHEDFARCPRLIKSGGTWTLRPPAGRPENAYQHPAPLPEPAIAKPVHIPRPIGTRYVAPPRQILTPIREQFGPFLPKAELSKIEARLIFPKVLALAAEIFDVPVIQFAGDRRSRFIAWPRQAVMVFLVNHTAWSLPMIGRAFGGRDHTTIIHATKVIQKHMTADPEYSDMVEIFNERARELLEVGG